MLKVLVLGSAAGGGSPQWNCNSHVSKLGTVPFIVLRNIGA